MGVVGVHHQHQFGAAVKRALEAGQVGPAEALLARTVQHLDRLQLRGQPVGDPARAVGRGVVDDQHAMLAGHEPLELIERRAHDPLDVAGLVVGGHGEPHTASVHPRNPTRLRRFVSPLGVCGPPIRFPGGARRRREATDTASPPCAVGPRQPRPSHSDARGSPRRARARASRRRGLPARVRPAPRLGHRRHQDQPARRSGPLPVRRGLDVDLDRAARATSRPASRPATCSRWGRSSPLGHAIGLSDWVVQRLWLGTVLALAAMGMARLVTRAARPALGVRAADGRGGGPAQPVRRHLRQPHHGDVAGLRGPAVADARRAPGTARVPRLALAGRLRAARHRLGRRGQRRGDRVDAARAGAAGGL